MKDVLTGFVVAMVTYYVEEMAILVHQWPGIY